MIYEHSKDVTHIGARDFLTSTCWKMHIIEIKWMKWVTNLHQFINKGKKMDATHVKGLFGKCFVTWLFNKWNYEKKKGFSAKLSNFAKILKIITKILKPQN